MSDTTKETSETISMPEPVARFNPDALSAFMNRAAPTVSQGGTGQALRRREATVVVDHRLCEPGYFDEPFKLGVHSLNSADELEALKAGGTETALGHLLAKKSIRTLNGRPMKSYEVDTLWEVLGTAGRMVVVNTFMAHCTGQDDLLLGKSLASVEVG